MTRNDAGPGTPFPDLPPELRTALGSGQVDRRSLLRGAGLAGTAAVLAACGVKGTAAGDVDADLQRRSRLVEP